MITIKQEKRDESCNQGTLLSKPFLDRVESINKNTSVSAEVCEKPDSGESEDWILDNPILADTPNLYKRNGVFMTYQGHLEIPRSLHENPKYFNSNPIYQGILNRFFYLAAFADMDFDIDGNTLYLKRGELCYSWRKLKEKCGEKVTMGFLRGAIRYFARVGFLTHKLTHDRLHIKLDKSILCEHTEKRSNTQSNTELTHNLHSKEELQEISKDICITKSDSQARPTKVEKIYFDWKEKKICGIEKCDLDKWREIFPNVDVIQYLKFIEEDIGRRETKYKKRKRIVHTILIYFKNENENAISRKNRYLKQNQPNRSFQLDDRPVQYVNKISFAEEV